MATTAPHPDDRLLDALRDEFGRHEPALAERVLDVLVEHRDGHDNLDEAIWGPAPTLEEALTAEIRSHQLLQQARGQVLATTLSRAEAAERLGVGPQRISRLVTDGDLIALEADGQLRLPAWQFHPDTARGRLEHIGEVARAHAGGPLTLTQWMLRPNPALAGRTPVDALIDDDHGSVVTAAAARV